MGRTMSSFESYDEKDIVQSLNGEAYMTQRDPSTLV